jgi:hypothetical protein
MLSLTLPPIGRAAPSSGKMQTQNLTFTRHHDLERLHLVLVPLISKDGGIMLLDFIAITQSP